MPLQAVDALSDSGNEENQPTSSGGPSGSGPERGLKRDVKGIPKKAQGESLSERLARLLRGVCKCSRLAKVKRVSCFQKLAPHSKRLKDMREKLKSLHKLDQDQEAGFQFPTPSVPGSRLDEGRMAGRRNSCAFLASGAYLPPHF